jgi:hypothetical protein
MREKPIDRDPKEKKNADFHEEIGTSAFENDLRATLDWLAESSPSDESFGKCPEMETVVSYARGEHSAGLTDHIKDCRRCSDLLAYVRQRDHVYQRQREYFLKQVEAEYGNKPGLSTFQEIFRQTFRPLEMLARSRVLVPSCLVLLAMALVVWQLPTFVAGHRASFDGLSVDLMKVQAGFLAERDYRRIQEASALDPKAAERILSDLRVATQKGGLVPPESMDAVLLSVERKKVEAPEKSGDWDLIENELRVYALLNRYGQLRSEKRTGAPLWKDFVGGSAKDGNALIHIGRERSYGPETYRLLEESRLGTKGVAEVRLVTPSNKEIVLTGNLQK